MSDLISRQAAIEALCHDCAYYTDAQCKTDSGYWCESGAMIREDVPSAEAVSREFYEDVVKANHGLAKENINLKAQIESAEAEWIPVSERLPIPPTFCLVTTDGSHGDVIDIALYMSDGWHKASEVLAWMPLPEPYGGDEG